VTLKTLIAKAFCRFPDDVTPVTTTLIEVPTDIEVPTGTPPQLGVIAPGWLIFQFRG
jgi:hypothetical protein